MSFLRPAVEAGLRRWREVILWGGVLALGVWLVGWGLVRAAPLVVVAGLVCGGTGLALVRGAYGRMRLGSGPPGPGVLVIDEGRIGLMGPQGGGYVDVPGLVSVAVAGRPGTAGRVWILEAEDGVRLVVPFGALGAEDLPDALAVLPGIAFGAAARGDGTLWVRGPSEQRVLGRD